MCKGVGMRKFHVTVDNDGRDLRENFCRQRILMNTTLYNMTCAAHIKTVRLKQVFNLYINTHNKAPFKKSSLNSDKTRSIFSL